MYIHEILQRVSKTPGDRTVIGVQSIGSQRNAAREKLLLCENHAS
jgi:hypothetical protein